MCRNNFVVLFTLPMHNQRTSVLGISAPCTHCHIPDDWIVINCVSGDLVRIEVL